MGRSKTYDRAELLTQATKTFWRYGYWSTTIAALVEATGVDKKTLFREFVSKERLFADALRKYVELGRAHIDAKLMPEPLGLNNIRRYLDSMAMWTTNPSCLLSKALSEFDLLADEHKKIVSDALAYLETGFARNLRAARSGGELPASAEIKKLAKYLLYSVYGMSSMGHHDGSKANVKQVADVLVRGLGQGS